MTRFIDYQDSQPVDEKLRDQPNKIIAFSTEVIVRLAKFAEFEEYLAKHGKIHIWKIMKTNIRHTSHERSYST